MKRFSSIILICILSFSLWGNDGGIDEDALFGGEDDFGMEDSLFSDDLVTEVESDETYAPEDDLLVSEQIKWGGSIATTLKATYFWNDYIWSPGWDNNAAELVEPSISSRLYFDARPKKDFRVFGKLAIETPFEMVPAIEVMGYYLKIPNIKVFELYSDFNYKELIFFRVGKQTVNWGVGYFWRPADVLSLDAIDVNDPTAEREGPVAVKMNVPFDIHNSYLYCIIPNTITAVSDIALAPKAEFVAGSAEVSVGGFFQHKNSLNGSLTATLPVNDFRFFGEAAVKVAGDLFDNSTKEPVFSGTLGGSYINTDLKLSVMGQYFYNGEVANNKHHGAASLVFSELFKSKLDLSLLWLGDLYDFSGVTTLGLTWSFFDYASIRGDLNFIYGDDTDSYVVSYMGSRFSAGVTVSIGGGSF